MKANYDESQELDIIAELERIGNEIYEYDQEEERRIVERRLVEHEKRWWMDPARTLDELAARDAPPSLKQSLERDDVLRTSCHVFKRYCYGLEGAAFSLGLAYECVDKQPGT